MGHLALSLARLVALGSIALSGCDSGTGGGGVGGASSSSSAQSTGAQTGSGSETTGPQEPCCPAPGQLGYNPSGHCTFDGEVCPYLWLDTGAAGGGVVTCKNGAWQADECPWLDAFTDDECPSEGSDLGACEPEWEGVRCPCLCSEGAVCSQSASCVDGRWSARVIEVVPDVPCPVP